MKYFTPAEFQCTHTGHTDMNDQFLDKLDQLREACGFPFTITSGYRDPSHPVEMAKPKARRGKGTHCLGIAADIAVSGGTQRYDIINQALRLGFNGIGVAKSFIHVDTRSTQPVIWSY